MADDEARHPNGYCPGGSVDTQQSI